MFHVRHQFRFCAKQSSWATALKFIITSSTQQQTITVDDDHAKNKQNPAVLFNNLVRFGYERNNSHLIRSLQQINNHIFHLNVMGVRSSLSILEKWESNAMMNEQERINFAFWICRNLPLVLSSSSSTTASHSSQHQSKQLTTTAIISRLVHFFIRIDHHHQTNAKGSFLGDEASPRQELLRLFAQARALGIVDADPSMIAMYLKLANYFRTSAKSSRFLLQQEATRLLQTISSSQQSTTMFNDYSRLLASEESDQGKVGSMIIQQVVSSNKNSSAVVTILDSNMLIYFLLKDEAIYDNLHQTIVKMENDSSKKRFSEQLFNALFHPDSDKKMTMTMNNDDRHDTFFIFVVSHVVRQEVVAWFRRNDNQIVTFTFSEKSQRATTKTVQVRVPSKSCLELLESMIVKSHHDHHQNHKWLFLSAEESVANDNMKSIHHQVKNDDTCQMMIINDVNDDAIVRLADEVAKEVQKVKNSKCSVIVATRDGEMSEKIKQKGKSLIGVWP